MAEKRGGGEITCTRPRGPRRFKGKEGGSRSLAPRPARAASLCTSAQRASSLVAFRILFRRPSAPGRGYTRLRSRRLVAASLPSPSPSPSSLLSPSSLPSPSACEGATYLPRLSLLPSPRFPPPSSFPRVSISPPLFSISLLSWAASTLHGRRTRRERILSAHTRARRAPQEARFSSADDSRPSSPL